MRCKGAVEEGTQQKEARSPVTLSYSSDVDQVCAGEEKSQKALPERREEKRERTKGASSAHLAPTATRRRSHSSTCGKPRISSEESGLE